MHKYFVTAKKQSGEVVKEELEAKDREDLYAQIKRSGESLVSVKEHGGSLFSRAEEYFEKIFAGVSAREKIIFARNLSAMLQAGLSLSRAISVLMRQTKNAYFKSILEEISLTIEKGGTFSQGLEKFPKVFSSLFIFMVRAGEESGGMGEALGVVADQLDKNHDLVKRVRSALIYPCIVLSAMFAAGVLMFIFVIPTLTETFKELKVDLPTSTKIIIAVSDFMKNNTVLFLVIFVAVIFSLLFASRTKGGRRAFDFLVLHIPIIKGLVAEVNAARTARTISSLLSAGVPIISALKITTDVLQNSFYKEVTIKAQEVVQKGQPMSEVFLENEKLYPVLVGEMMAVGEETGKIADMSKKLALFYEEEVEQKTRDLSTIIEPFLMIIVGIGVGFFAMAMLSPTYSLINSI